MQSQPLPCATALKFQPIRLSSNSFDYSVFFFYNIVFRKQNFSEISQVTANRRSVDELFANVFAFHRLDISPKRENFYRIGSKEH